MISKVLFFFVCVQGLVGIGRPPILACQPSQDPWPEPTGQVRERIENATPEQWRRFVTHSARALLGVAWRDAIGTPPANDLPRSQRVEWFLERVSHWTQSHAFMDEQKRTWVAQRCGGSIGESGTWDFRLHDQWIERQIANNASFLHFLQWQIAGDLMPDDHDDKLGTAIWFRSKSPSRRGNRTRSSESHAPGKVPSLTPDELPKSLQWTYLSQLPWLYADVSASQRQRLLDLEVAMESVLRAEQENWGRLQDDTVVRDAHRRIAIFPKPNPEDRTFQLAEHDDTETTVYPAGSAWSYARPWSAILEIEILPSQDTGAVGSCVLVRQRSECNTDSIQDQSCAIEWEAGKIRVGLHHAFPQSFLEVETEPVFREPGHYTIAVVYEGMPSADSIRIWFDDAWLPTRLMHDLVVGDFASRDTPCLEIAVPSMHEGCRVHQLECYRSSLTAIELSGWRQQSEWKIWEECSEEERQRFREHYAKRVDLQWRYQRESLLFYVDNFASQWLRIGKLPIADSSWGCPIPAGLAEGIIDRDTDANTDAGGDSDRVWDASSRLWLANRCGGEYAMVVAEREALRQWRGMLESLSKNGQTLPIGEDWKRVSDRWRFSWDRRELMTGLLLSESWVGFAIDLSP